MNLAEKIEARLNEVHDHGEEYLSPAAIAALASAVAYENFELLAKEIVENVRLLKEMEDMRPILVIEGPGRAGS